MKYSWLDVKPNSINQYLIETTLFILDEEIIEGLEDDEEEITE